MPFDLDNLNPSTRFYWTAGDPEELVNKPDAEYVEMRLCPDDMTDEIRKQVGITRKVEYHRDRGRINRIEYLDSSDGKVRKFAEAVNDFCITGWRLLTRTGDEIPCTTENKIKMLLGSPAFSEWYADKMEELRKIAQNKDREIKENLSNTQGD